MSKLITEGFDDVGLPTLKYDAFDWDDNLMFMPTKIILKNDGGEEVEMSTEDFAEYRSLGRLNKAAGMRETLKPQYSDASITLLSSSNKPYFRFKFYDVFPTTLTTFVMATTDSPESQLTADGTFRYSYYDIEKLF